MTGSTTGSTTGHGSTPYDADRVYALLPAYLRVRDEELGARLRAEAGRDDALSLSALDHAPLRSLVELFAAELAALHEGTQQMYDDLFIETCAEWVVPYIGELVGVRLPPEALLDELNPRALVADAVADRRRKGTIGGLERVADAAVASWVARATEYWQRLVQTVDVNHLRPDHLATPELTDQRRRPVVDSPFDTSARSIEMWDPTDGGRFNIPNVGIELWRVTSQRRLAGRASRHDGRRMRFDPLNRDIALFTRPTPVVGEVRVDAQHVPVPLTRDALHAELASKAPSAVEIAVDGQPVPIEEIVVCHLGDDPNQPGGWVNSGPLIFADDHTPIDPGVTRVDPELGRLVLGAIHPAGATVVVTYHHGAAHVLGGGSYARPVETPAGATLVAAAGLAAAAAAARVGGVVVVTDSDTTEQPPVVVVDRDASATVVASDGEQPVLRPAGGTLTIRLFPGSELVLDGLMVDADVEIVKPEPDAAGVVLRDCTVAPGRSIRLVGPALTARAERSILAGTRLSSDSVLDLVDCIVDATHPSAPAIVGGGILRCGESTVVGRIDVDQLAHVSNSLLVAQRAAPADPAPVRAARRQVGCVRFSWLPHDAQTPARYRCVPAGADDVAGPIFESMRFGDATYLQLDGRTPEAITEGADDRSEMGVGHRRHQRAREIVLADQLDEYVRFGMAAGVHHAT